MTHTVAANIANAVVALKNSKRSGNDEWAERWEDKLRYIESNLLPSGSGFDGGTTIDRAKSTSEKLILRTAFHHLNENGYYDGWTEHVVSVLASFVHGMKVRVGGRDRNGIKDYIAEVFDVALRQQFVPPPAETEQEFWERWHSEEEEALLKQREEQQ